MGCGMGPADGVSDGWRELLMDWFKQHSKRVLRSNPNRPAVMLVITMWLAMAVVVSLEPEASMLWARSTME